MIDIEVNKLGKILNGEMKGWFIVIKDDSKNTGGYLVILSRDNKFSNEGYDNWFLNLEEVEQYFQDYQIQVEWIENM